MGAAFQTGELASVLVILKTADGLPISGREVVLIVDPADNLKLSPSMVTDQEGKVSFSFTSSQPGIRMITVSVGSVQLDLCYGWPPAYISIRPGGTYNTSDSL